MLTADTSSILRNFIGRQITFSGAVPTYVHDNPSLPILSDSNGSYTINIPAHFEWKRDKMVPIRDQGVCASCWAFSVSDMIADRLAIYTNGAVRKNLSVQFLLSCFRNHAGCETGGSPEQVYSYIATNGLPLDDVYPYEQFKKMDIDQCQTHRLPPTNERVFIRAGSDRSLCTPYPGVGTPTHRQNIHNMQLDILLNGPIVGTLAVYQTLYQYQGAPNIYEQGPSSQWHGGHSCEILGWNTKAANPYWIVRTPWGGDWPRSGSGGVVYVKFGVNECGIEERASSAMTEIPTQYLNNGSAPSAPSTSFYELEV